MKVEDKSICFLCEDLGLRKRMNRLVSQHKVNQLGGYHSELCVILYLCHKAAPMSCVLCVNLLPMCHLLTQVVCVAILACSQ